MENCTTGISITTTEEICGGKYTSSSCVSIPNNITYLDISAGDSQTTVNAALVTALMYKDEQISSLPTIAQDLQDVVNINNQVSEKSIDFTIDNEVIFKTSIDGFGVKIGNNNLDTATLNEGGLDIDNPTGSNEKAFYGGNSIFFGVKNGIGGYFSSLNILPNLSEAGETNLYAMSKTGDFYINSTYVTPYTVANLPSAILNDMAIVLDAIAPTYLGALTGGGMVVCPVWYNGTIWVSR